MAQRVPTRSPRPSSASSMSTTLDASPGTAAVSREVLEAQLSESKRSEDVLRYKVQALEEQLASVRQDQLDNAEKTNVARGQINLLRARHADEVAALYVQLHAREEMINVVNASLSAAEQQANATRLDAAKQNETVALLRSQLAERERSFAAESQTRTELVELLNARVVKAECSVAEAEAKNQSIKRALEKSEKEVAQERLARQQAEEKLMNATQAKPDALASATEGTGTISLTSMYAASVRAKEELAQERQISSQLRATLEELVAQLQVRKPVLEAQRQETVRLRVQVKDLSLRFAQAVRTGEQDRQQVTRLQKQAKDAYVVQQAAEQQVTDLSRQLREVMRQLVLRDDPSAATRLADDGSALPPAPLIPATTEPMDVEGEAVLRPESITFRSLSELLARNSALLKRVRGLTRVVRDERETHAAQLEMAKQANEKALQALQRKQEELVQFERARFGALERERDMLRSLRPLTPQAPNGTGATPPRDDGTTEKPDELAALQAHFSTFKTETKRDCDLLKADLAAARAQARKEALKASRETSTRESVEARLRTLQAAYDMQKKELDEVSKIVTTLRDNLGKRDGAAQQFITELTEVKETLATVRKEALHIQLERDALQATQTRLVQHNDALTKERSNLSQLLANLSRSQSESERQAKIKIDTLQSKLTNETKVASEAIEHSAAVQQELDQLRNETSARINELEEVQRTLETSLSEANSQLSTVTASLQAAEKEVTELKQQLGNRDEKLAVFERHAQEAAARAATASATGNADANAGGAEVSARSSREQVLEITIADLRTEVHSAKEEAAQAVSEAEAAKQTTEAAQADLERVERETQMELAERDATIAAKQIEIDRLQNEVNEAQSRVAEAQNELEKVQTQLVQLEQDAAQASVERSEREKAYSSVDERVRQKTEVIRAEAQRYADAAAKANQKFQSELMAHAEDVRALHAARNELDQLRKAVPNTTANAASANELAELQRSKQKLEQVVARLTKDLARIARGESSAGATQLSEDLQDVQEIARKQAELQQYELIRWKSQAQSAQQALAEAQAELAKLQAAGAGESGAEAQLNVLKESNSTLRERLTQSSQRVRSLETELATSQTQMSHVQNQLEALNEELTQLREQHAVLIRTGETERLRADELQAKFGHLDPDVVDQLKREISAKQVELEKSRSTVSELTNERDTLRAQVEEIQASGTSTASELTAAQRRVTELEAQVVSLEQSLQEANAATAQGKTLFQKLRQQTIEKLQSKSAEAASAQAELQKQIDELTTQLAAQETKASEVRSQLEEQIKQLQAQAAAAADVNVKEEKTEEEPTTSATTNVSVEAAWEEERTQLLARVEELEKAKAEVDEKVATVSSELETTRTQLTEAQTQLAEAQTKLAEAQKSSEETKASDAPETSISNEVKEASSDDEVIALRERVAELEAQVSVLEGDLASMTQQAQTAQEEKQAAVAKCEEAVEQHKSLQATYAVMQEEHTQERARALEEAIAEITTKHQKQLDEKFEAGKQEAQLRFKLIEGRSSAKIVALEKQVAALTASQAETTGESGSNVTAMSNEEDDSVAKAVKDKRRKRINSSSLDASSAKRARQGQAQSP